MLVSSDTTHPSGSIPPINLAQVCAANFSAKDFEASRQRLEVKLLGVKIVQVDVSHVVGAVRDFGKAQDLKVLFQSLKLRERTKGGGFEVFADLTNNPAAKKSKTAIEVDAEDPNRDVDHWLEEMLHEDV